MLKFEVGEHYITTNTHRVVCCESNSCYSEFYDIQNNIKYKVYRNEYNKFHDYIDKGQLSGKVFYFDSSLSFKTTLFKKLTEVGGGMYSNNVTKKVTHFITNDFRRSIGVASELAYDYKIKKFPEKIFWELYYCID